MPQFELQIDPAVSLAPYEQLRDRVVALIVSGELAPGAKLPPVRSLAAELGLAANTVARAYRELESSGFVQTRGRNGTIVAPDLGEAETHERALALTREYVAAMAALGIEGDRLADYLRRA
ncbi:GntR family transcriptional regulator [Leucobacter ruminantium]|uniref:GntR family transcriptional regulator n=1 Tax=Leucobacter ruminantium TaxID=1289170 RepID=A0A939LX12_9MICO|nr:GntR family transcriptional regulator [Leucobacter ruminantium]MBO1806275.1 GntR family transcriptional regulator [Leucobacter ruminantium]